MEGINLLIGIGLGIVYYTMNGKKFKGGTKTSKTQPKIINMSKNKLFSKRNIAPISLPAETHKKDIKGNAKLFRKLLDQEDTTGLINPPVKNHLPGLTYKDVLEKAMVDTTDKDAIAQFWREAKQKNVNLKNMKDIMRFAEEKESEIWNILP